MNNEEPRVTANEHNPDNKQFDVSHAPTPHVVHVQKSPLKKVFLGLLIALLIAGNAILAYMYYEQSKDVDAYKKQVQELQVSTLADEVITEDNTEATLEPEEYDAFVVVGQQDGSSAVVSPDKIAKNQDQIDILLALRNYCRNKNADLIGVYYKVFDDSTYSVIKNDRAFIGAAQCTDESTDAGGAKHLLYKNSQGQWYYHFGSQDTPGCERVDGWGYPKEIVPECVEQDGTTRAPKQ